MQTFNRIAEGNRRKGLCSWMRVLVGSDTHGKIELWALEWRD
jgi:hypothetical protein